MSATVHHGDCLDVLRGMGEASVDAVVTDPPAGISFMSKAWDHDRGGRDAWIAWMREVAAECLRVAKPGAHALVWALPRTSHWTATAWEDAGWEVRDRVAHLFGTGFPKSLDVGKAIDRARDDGDERRAVGAWLRAQREAAGLRQKDVAALWPSATGGQTGCVANWELGLNFPLWDQWLALKARVGFGDEMDAEVWRLNGRKGQPGEAWHDREFLGRGASGKSAIMRALAGHPDGVGGHDITAPATPEAARWSGWGTALKPAVEDWWLLRKPLACPTVAAQVLQNGCGALNVDATRIPADWENDPNKRGLGYGFAAEGYDKKAAFANSAQRTAYDTTKGRWPANLVTDGSPEVLEAFAKFGESKSQPHVRRNTGRSANFDHGRGLTQVETSSPYADTGTAARFFYSAKASKTDRCGSRHPTIKPVALMRWLCRLVTPPGGTVLDPFAGSGTTGEAALREGFSAVLIEREAEYHADILARLARHRAEAPLLAEVAA